MPRGDKVALRFGAGKGQASDRGMSVADGEAELARFGPALFIRRNWPPPAPRRGNSPMNGRTRLEVGSPACAQIPNRVATSMAGFPTASAMAIRCFRRECLASHSGKSTLKAACSGGGVRQSSMTASRHWPVSWF